jgi:alkylation response protein AidB-like acyl-CoA dehydrogenase
VQEVRIAGDAAMSSARTGSFHEQLDSVSAALEEALVKQDFAPFWKLFRTTDLPFLCGPLASNPRELFGRCCEVVHRLGSISPATAFAIENHYFVCASVATYPATGNSNLERTRSTMLDFIVGGRLLLANTASRTHGKKLNQSGTRVVREGTKFRVTGHTAFVSLANQADVLILGCEIEGEGSALFAVPMKATSGLEIGPFLFPDAMLDSETRKVIFNDVLLEPEYLVSSPSTQAIQTLTDFELLWHQTLSAAVYLGAGAGALDEARRFLLSTQGADGRPLGELDGMVTDMGRLSLQYHAACTVVTEAGNSLAQVRNLPEDEGFLVDSFRLARAAKYVGTRCAEDLVTAARRIVGTRSFTGGHRLERLSKEVVFGSLSLEVGAQVERRFGRDALKDTPLPSPFTTTVKQPSK